MKVINPRARQMHGQSCLMCSGVVFSFGLRGRNKGLALFGFLRVDHYLQIILMSNSHCSGIHRARRHIAWGH
jgi:hypothetical protein